MKSYIARVLPRLREYSARLDNLALFADHPWIQIDESGDRTVFVFRDAENELLISKNGNVNTCNWEYLDYMNSLLIEVDGKKTLYNQGFLDEAVMILSKDGQTDYLLLANENKVAERDAEKILANLSRKYLSANNEGVHYAESDRNTDEQKQQSSEIKSIPYDSGTQKKDAATLLVIGLITLVILAIASA